MAYLNPGVSVSVALVVTQLRLRQRLFTPDQQFGSD